MRRSNLELVSGWGRTPVAGTHVIYVRGELELHQTLARCREDPRGVIPRGLGRSYGDAAQRSGGTTVIVEPTSEPSWLDREAGLVRCQAGTSIGELVGFADREGFFVPVTPGTRYVTVGGAIAADIHGKDHHAVGSFGAHVASFRMMLASGDLVEVDRSSDSDLFRATVGGMGLTGIILDAVIRMTPVTGNRILVDTYRTRDLESTMSAVAEAESEYRYSVAWIDLTSRGAGMGRGVITNGNHTESPEGDRPLRDGRFSVPRAWRLKAVVKPGVRAFNELWFRKAPRYGRQTVQSYDKFFYPLDMIGDWNRLYGKRGFLQYQFVTPLEAEERLPWFVESLSSSRAPVALAVLKRFGPTNDAYLSFPKRGWTLASDIPIPRSPTELEGLLRGLDVRLAETGGRVYLAKDSRLGSDLMAAMYPELESFREVRDRVDPQRVFQSDLAARLGL